MAYLNNKLPILDQFMMEDLIAESIVKHEQSGTMLIDHEALSLEFALALDEPELLVCDEIVAEFANTHARSNRVHPAVERQLGSMLIDLADLARQQLLECERVRSDSVFGQFGRQIRLVFVNGLLDLCD